MTPEETFGQLLGLGEAWRVLEAPLEASSSTLLLKVEATPDLWSEESARAGTPMKVTSHDHLERMPWRHLNAFNKERVIVCALPAAAPWRRRQGVPCDPAVGAAQQALLFGF